MPLDECTEFPASAVTAEKAMERTLAWAAASQRAWRRLAEGNGRPAEGENFKFQIPNSKQTSRIERSGFRIPDSGQIPLAGRAEFPIPNSTEVPVIERAEFNPPGALFGIVQGGTHPELRRQCAGRLVEMGFAGYAIGGLSVGEARPLTMELVAATEELLPAEQPRYVMGVGLPEELPQYVALGVDMMDCVLPTRNGRNGCLFTSQGKLHIRNARFARDPRPPDESCACPVCQRYSRAYLRHLFVSDEMLGRILNTQHNVHFYLDTMRRIRQSIGSGSFSRFSSEFRSRLQGEVP
jgi:tRNA-guanine family transglycosylase